MKTCITCHIAKPYDTFYKRASAKDGYSPVCKDCQRIYVRDWKRSNKDKVKAISARHYNNRKEHKRAYGKQWREQNKERHREMVKRWEAEHPDRVAAKYLRYRERNPEKFKKWQDDRRDSGRRRISNWIRRARIASQSISGYELTEEVLRGRCDMFGWRCRYCGKALTSRTVEADHRIPISRGGLNCGANIVPCCRTCNVRKSSKTESEYLAVLGVRSPLDVPEAA